MPVVPVLPPSLTPVAGEQGLLSADLAALGAATVAAWDLFLGTVERLDPDAPARAKGWTVREVVVHVGAWDDSRRLADILADARAGRTTTEDHDAIVQRLLARHGAAPYDEALAMVRRAREEAATWFASPDLAAEAVLVSPSLLGPLPVATLVHATAYQLSVAALDLAPAGAEVPDDLLVRGLRSLVDSAGALAGRAGVTASLAALTPQARVGTGADGSAWRTADLPADEAEVGPAIQADVRVVLDVTSGRAAVPALYASGALRVSDLTGLMRMGRVVDAVPGLPGGTALRRAITVMDAVGGTLARLPFGRRR